MNKETLEEAARAALRDVFDPETGLSLIDLGLIYGVTFDPDRSLLHVLMTFTTPFCPASHAIGDGVDRRLRLLPYVEDVDVEVTFEPPWTPERISPEGRRQLGWG